MLNQVILIGRFIKRIDENTIQIKNSLEKEEILINIKTFSIVNKDIDEYIADNSIVGIKGHINYIDDNMVIIADRISFLSKGKKEEDE